MKKLQANVSFIYAHVSSMIAFVLLAMQTNICFAETKPLPSWSPDRACLQQFESAGKECSHQKDSQATSMSALQQCIHGKISLDCMNQIDSAKKNMMQAMAPCTEASQQAMQAIKAACGVIAKENQDCFKKIASEQKAKVEVACKGLR